MKHLTFTLLVLVLLTTLATGALATPKYVYCLQASNPFALIDAPNNMFVVATQAAMGKVRWGVLVLIDTTNPATTDYIVTVTYQVPVDAATLAANPAATPIDNVAISRVARKSYPFPVSYPTSTALLFSDTRDFVVLDIEIVEVQPEGRIKIDRPRPETAY